MGATAVMAVAAAMIVTALTMGWVEAAAMETTAARAAAIAVTAGTTTAVMH